MKHRAGESETLTRQCSHESCEPSDELQESLGPSGPQIPKKSEKSLPEASGPGGGGSRRGVSGKISLCLCLFFVA